MKRRWMIVILVGSVAGCGGPNLAPVSGQVTLDGRPLDGATVLFQPIEGKEPGQGSRGVTGPDGRFELETFDRHLSGAIVGNHRVIISKPSGDDTSAIESVPTQYNDESKLNFLVPDGGTDKAVFDLKTR